MKMARKSLALRLCLALGTPGATVGLLRKRMQGGAEKQDKKGLKSRVNAALKKLQQIKELLDD